MWVGVMLIFSKINNYKKFIEIDSIEECDKVMADCIALIRIKSEIIYRNSNYFGYNEDDCKEYLESCFKLGEELKCNEVDYAVFVDFDADLLHTILLMFAQCGASFFIMDKTNRYLHEAQAVANQYLLDTKILALVESYMDIRATRNWCDLDVLNGAIVIDGIVEKDLLFLK